LRTSGDSLPGSKGLPGAMPELQQEIQLVEEPERRLLFGRRQRLDELDRGRRFRRRLAEKR
jgi:hypothetical protein